MPPSRDTFESVAHRPTSLDYINLPNPVEPDSHSGSQKHPLNGTPRLEKARLEKAPSRDLFSFFHDASSADRPAKRPKPTENPLELDLPKLPVKNAVKRQRLPPTLSGLHHPPPDAGILPSISTEKPQTPPQRNVQPAVQPPPRPAADSADAGKHDASTSATEKSSKSQKKRVKRNKWSHEETEFLLRGALRFGVGSWTKILNCPDYEFNNRTAIDLKDRFRVVCPEHYKSGKSSKASSSSRIESDTENQPPSVTKPVKGPPAERLSPCSLKAMGIDQSFGKSKRRSRHGYSDAEDQALLSGFKKHGTSWASIQQDEALGLSKRTARDLRDRLRTKFPEEYARAGLAVRKTKPRQANDSSNSSSESDGEPGPSGSTAATTKGNMGSRTSDQQNGTSKDDEPHAKANNTRKPSFFSLDEVFLGNLYGEDDADADEPITLDRGILDWAGADNARTTTGNEPASNSGIDPLMTLKLPKPVSTLQTPAPGFPHSLPTNNTASLPSLSNLLPDQSNSEQLELPSLMQWFGSAENDGKNAGVSIPTFDELFGQ